MDHNAAIEVEAQRILASDKFARSPAQSTMLKYLVKRSEDPSKPVTQFDLAVDAMGRSSTFDEISDSSVRVQMGRLRKSLEEYYRLHKPKDDLALYIRSGEYKLRLARLTTAYPDIATERGADPAIAVPQPTSALVSAEQTPDASPSQSPAPVRQFGLLRILVLVSVLACLSAWLVVRFDLVQTISGLFERSPLSAPSVSVEIKAGSRLDDTTFSAETSRVLALSAERVLKKSMISLYAPDDEDTQAEYHIDISIMEGANQQVDGTVDLRNADGLVITSRDFQSLDRLSAIDRVQDILISIVSPAGVLTNDLAKEMGPEPRNGFECLLAVESFRSRVDGNKGNMLGFCLSKISKDSYYPYLAARQVFLDINARRLKGERLSREDSEWSTISELLDQYPDNSYTNSVAAKMLIGAGACQEARKFATSAFERGRTYPALELAVIVDAYGCPEVRQYKEYWDLRIRAIALANPAPQPLLESYILIGLTLSDQGALEDEIKPLSFSSPDASLFSKFNKSFRRLLNGTATQSDLEHVTAMMPAFIWNPRTIREIESKLTRELANSQAARSGT